MHRDPLRNPLTSRTRNTWADSRRELAFRKLLRDPPARARSEHRCVYSVRGIRVTRALQILFESLLPSFSLSFFLSPPPSLLLSLLLLSTYLLLSAVPGLPRPRRAPPVIRSTKARSDLQSDTAARYARLLFWRGISAAAPSTRGAAEIPSRYPRSRATLVSLGKVNTIPLLPYVFFSSFSAKWYRAVLSAAENSESQDHHFRIGMCVIGALRPIDPPCEKNDLNISVTAKRRGVIIIIFRRDINVS